MIKYKFVAALLVMYACFGTCNAALAFGEPYSKGHRDSSSEEHLQDLTNIASSVDGDSLATFQEKWVSTEGAELYCRLFGQGDPIIIIHGAPALTQDYLLPYLADLSENNLVIFYDQRGCGRSTGKLVDEDINVSTFVQDIEAIRKMLNVNQVTLLGHSWGGFLAMSYTIQYPTKVDKLILLDTMPASQDEFTQFIEEVMRRLAPIHDELQLLEATELYQSGDPQTIEKQLKMVFQTYFYDPENVNKLHFNISGDAFRRGSKVFTLLCNQIFLKPYDIYSDLSKIQSPTLVVHGDADPISYKMAEHIHQTIPNSQFALIECCGHFPYAEKPQIMFPVIKKFIRN